MRPSIQGFFDETTFTISYVIWDPSSHRAAIVDPVLDFDRDSGATSHKSADALISFVRDQGLAIDWILETHAHADHLTGAPYLKEKLGGRIAIGANIVDVQKTFAGLFNFEATFKANGEQFDHLFAEEEVFEIGELAGRVLHTPGHTPACISYIVGDAAFVGDTLFMPDFGTARADFPGGDAATLYRSIKRILALPDETRLFMCHDYKAPGREEYAWETTVADERANNIHVNDRITEQEFIAMRTERDADLPVPKLLLPSVQVNIRAGHMPPPEANGVSYLKLPVDVI